METTTSNESGWACLGAALAFSGLGLTLTGIGAILGLPMLVIDLGFIELGT